MTNATVTATVHIHLPVHDGHAHHRAAPSPLFLRPHHQEHPVTLIELRDAIDKALTARPDMGRMQVATAEYHSPADEKPTLLGALYGLYMDGDTAVITHRSNPWPTRPPTPSGEVIAPIPTGLAGDDADVATNRLATVQPVPVAHDPADGDVECAECLNARPKNNTRGES